MCDGKIYGILNWSRNLPTFKLRSFLEQSLGFSEYRTHLRCVDQSLKHNVSCIFFSSHIFLGSCMDGPTWIWWACGCSRSVVRSSRGTASESYSKWSNYQCGLRTMHRPPILVNSDFSTTCSTHNDPNNCGQDGRGALSYGLSNQSGESKHVPVLRRIH